MLHKTVKMTIYKIKTKKKYFHKKQFISRYLISIFLFNIDCEY